MPVTHICIVKWHAGKEIISYFVIYRDFNSNDFSYERSHIYAAETK